VLRSAFHAAHVALIFQEPTSFVDYTLVYGGVPEGSRKGCRYVLPRSVGS
jgi:hypothetical protein